MARIADRRPLPLVPALAAGLIVALVGWLSLSPASAEIFGRLTRGPADACRIAMDPKFASFAIYEHCLPFNVSRAYDEARGIEWPVVWTAERDREMWAALQG